MPPINKHTKPSRTPAKATRRSRQRVIQVKTVPRQIRAVMKKLLLLDFSKSPYKGLVARVGTKHKFSDRRTAHRAIFKNYNIDLVLALAAEVRRVERELERRIKELA